MGGTFRHVLLVAILAAGQASTWGQEAPGPPASGAPTARRLTLADAIALARANNPNLQAAVETSYAARNRVDEVKALRLPQVYAGGSFTFQGPAQEIQIPGAPGEPTRRVELTKELTSQLQATATLDPNLTGRLSERIRIARSNAQALASSARTTENNLIYRVTAVYAEVLRAQDLVRVGQESVGAAREQLRVADARFRAGVVPQFDVLRATVQVENLRQEQIGAENSQRTAEANLVALLNIDPTTRLELAPLPTPPDSTARKDPVAPAVVRPVAQAQPPAAQPPVVTPEPRILPEDLSPELKAAIEEAFRQRPEIQAARQRLEGAESGVRLEKKGYLPDVNIRADYTYNPDVSGFSSEKSNYSVITSLTIPIFTGGLIRSRVRAAQDERDVARAELDQAHQLVAVDVRTALLNLREAEQRRGTAEANVGQARAALKIARVRYTAGVSISVEVTDAVLALTQAQTNQVNADYDVILARAALDQALARPVAGGAKPEPGAAPSEPGAGESRPSSPAPAGLGD
jgi:outer membrane protein TolC